MTKIQTTWSEQQVDAAGREYARLRGWENATELGLQGCRHVAKRILAAAENAAPMDADFYLQRTDHHGMCSRCDAALEDGRPDPCLGWLPGIRSACCGHGDAGMAFVMFNNGTVIRGFNEVSLSYQGGETPSETQNATTD